MLLILRAVLEKLGHAYRIAAAGDGRDVLTKAKNQPLDLLISDVGMTDVEHPSTVGSYLIKKESQSSGKKDFFERGSVSEKVDLRKTVHPARAVFWVVQDAHSQGQIDKVPAQLLKEYDPLFESGSEI